MESPLRGHHDMPYLSEENDPVWNIIKSATGNLAFDIGANIGQASAILAQNFASVVALEPCEASYEVLAAEMPSNVTTRFLAASSAAGKLRLMASETHMKHGELVSLDRVAGQQMRFTGHVEIEATTIDEMAVYYGVPDFIKIDTEGHEVKVLEGAELTLMGHQPELLIEVHAAEHEVPIVRILIANDYEFDFIYHDEHRVSKDIRENQFWIHAVRGDEWAS